MILLWKAVVLEVGVKGLQAHAQNVWFAKNLIRSPENRVKMAPNVVWLQKMVPNVCMKTHETYFGSYTKKRSSWSLWGKMYWQKLHKIFSVKFGEIRAKFCTPEIGLLLHLWWKVTSAPVAPHLKGQRGKGPPPCLHSPARLCILLHTHSLYSLL